MDDQGEALSYPPYVFADPNSTSQLPVDPDNNHLETFSISPVFTTRLIAPNRLDPLFNATPNNWPVKTRGSDSVISSQPITECSMQGISVHLSLNLNGSHWFNKGKPVPVSIFFYTLRPNSAEITKFRTTGHVGQSAVAKNAQLRNKVLGLDYEILDTGFVDPTQAPSATNRYKRTRWRLNPELYNVRKTIHTYLTSNPTGLSNARLEEQQEDVPPGTNPNNTWIQPLLSVAPKHNQVQKNFDVFIPHRRKLKADVGVIWVSPGPSATPWYNGFYRGKGWRDLGVDEISDSDQLYMSIFHDHEWNTMVENYHNPPVPAQDDPTTSPPTLTYGWSEGTQNNMSPLSMTVSLRMNVKEPI